MFNGDTLSKGDLALSLNSASEIYDSVLLSELYRADRFDFETSHLIREDLLANEAYGTPLSAGLVLMSLGSPVEKVVEGDGTYSLKPSAGCEPSSVVKLFDTEGINTIINKVIVKNPLKELSDVRNPDVKKYKFTKNRGFVLNN